MNYRAGTRLNYKRLLHFEGTAYFIDFNNQVVIERRPGIPTTG